jgi:hypothetical protein
MITGFAGNPPRTPDQLALFAPGRSLHDASIERRLAGAEVLLDTTPTDLAEREALLLLVVAPSVWSGAER